MNRLISEYMKGDLGIVTPILAVLAAASALFTYGGASIDAENFLDKSKATVFALAGGSAIFLFWSVAMKVAPALVRRRDKILALTAILSGCALIFWLSSAFNVAGLAGRDALDKHLSTYIATLEETLDAQFKQSLLIEGVAVDLRGEINRYKQAAQNEFEGGAYSGNSGTGAVYGALNSIRGRLEDMARETDNFLLQTEQLSKASQARLEKIRTIAASDKPLQKRMRDIARESDALRIDLARMDAQNLADAIARMLEMLPREVDIQSRFSANAQTAARQKAALDKVRDDIERSGVKLGAFIESANARDTPQMQSFERISAVRAVVVYWPNYISYWAGGIALDIAPLAVVMFLMIAVGSKKRDELALIRIMDRRVGDVVDIHVAEQVIRSAAAEPQMLKDISHYMLGQEKRQENPE